MQENLIKHGMDSGNINIIFDEHTAVQYVLDNANEGDLIVLSNYDINGIQKRITDHKELLDKLATLESAKRIIAEA